MTHSTTAKDLAVIMNYCVWQSPEKEKFLDITQTQNYYFSDTEGKHSYSCVNHNALLSMIEGLVSGKTGFTGGAGYSYVAAFEEEDKHFSLALLGCGWPPHKTYKWQDAKALLSYGKEKYEKREVFQEPDFQPVVVKGGIPERGNLDSPACVNLTLNLEEEEKSLKVLMREDETIQIRLILPETLKAPVKEGAAVGYVVYSLEGLQIKSYPVYAEHGVDAISFGWCLRQIGKGWMTFSL